MARTRSGRHLFQRGETWYYRRIVPAECRKAFGQSVVAKSLETTSETEAEWLEKQHDVEFERRLREIRDAHDPKRMAAAVAQVTPIRITLSDKWGRVPAGEHLSDEDQLQAMSDANEHLLPRYHLLTEIHDLLSTLSGAQIAECRPALLSVLRHQIGRTTEMPVVVMDGAHTLEWGYDRWLRAGEGDRAPATVKLARRHWDAFVAHSKLVMLSDARRFHLLAWRDSLVDQGDHKPKSINQRVQLVTAILRAGWRDAEMPQPDLKSITVPEPDDSGRDAWTRDEILKALHTLEPQSWQAWLYLIGLTTSARLGEPVAAQRSWWNPKTGFIELRDRRLAKADKEHAMPIIECLRRPFEAYVEKRGDGFLFPAPRPKDPDVPISNVASKAMNRFFKRQGIDRVFHELRDTWIEEARHSPVKKELWEIISGHSAATVSDRYGGEKPEVLAKANEDVCSFITKDAQMMAAINRLVC